MNCQNLQIFTQKDQTEVKIFQKVLGGLLFLNTMYTVVHQRRNRKLHDMQTQAQAALMNDVSFRDSRKQITDQKTIIAVLQRISTNSTNLKKSPKIRS